MNVSSSPRAKDFLPEAQKALENVLEKMKIELDNDEKRGDYRKLAEEQQAVAASQQGSKQGVYEPRMITITYKANWLWFWTYIRIPLAMIGAIIAPLVPSIPHRPAATCIESRDYTRSILKGSGRKPLPFFIPAFWMRLPAVLIVASYFLCLSSGVNSG
jgi:hypothetical protein